MGFLIVLVALGAGAWAAIRWVPPLGTGGRVEEIVYWLVCGLVTTAVATIAFGVYMALQVLDVGDTGDGIDSAASVLLNALRDVGILLGIAAGIHLLAGPRSAADSAPPGVI